MSDRGPIRGAWKHLPKPVTFHLVACSPYSVVRSTEYDVLIIRATSACAEHNQTTGFLTAVSKFVGSIS